MEQDSDKISDSFEEALAEGIAQWVHVKLPQMPPTEMGKVAGEIMAVLEEVTERLQDGRAGTPAALVVVDERYPQIPAMQELAEYASIFEYIRSDPRGLVTQRR